jgi:PAS domain S-box-containing protein
MSDCAILECSIDGNIIGWNGGAEKTFGYSAREASGISILRLFPSESRKSVKRILNKAIAGRASTDFQTFGLRKDGRLLDVSVCLSGINGAAGQMTGICATIRDISQQKTVQARLSRLSRALISAHEEERSRIARELHDDFNQRLALMSIDLEQIVKTLPKTRGHADARLQTISTQIQEMSRDIHRLSHHLHPAKLDYLGLVAALRGCFAEIRSRQGLSVDFSHEEVPDDIPKEIALCLFRIAQESLHNVVKHSRVREAMVLLEGTPEGIHLRVRDKGVGFDVESAKTRGLGLVSITERARLVGGQISICSRPLNGAEIDVRVPLKTRFRSA